MLLVALVTGVNVIGIFLRDPWAAASAIWSEIYIAGNIIWVVIIIMVLYATNWDDWLLRRFKI